MSEDNLKQLVNIYSPADFNLAGTIKRVFPDAGDSDKMYFLDERITESSGKAYSVMLEISRMGIRPIYIMPGNLEA